MVQVNNLPYRILRVKFNKTGNLQYISHLDLVRTMQKVITRARLPLWYTEGFNPKPKMVFAAPLSIGTESLCEFMDIRLREYVEPADAMEELNKNLTAEMQVQDAYYPETKFTDMKWLSYTMLVKTTGNAEEICQSCIVALSSEKMELLKSTKSGEVIVDIRPLVKSSTVTVDNGFVKINCVLSSDPSSFLNPEYIVKYLREKCNILSAVDLTTEYYSIRREKAYKEDMTEFR